MTPDELYEKVVKFGVGHTVKTGVFHGLSTADKVIKIQDGVLIQNVPLVDALTGGVKYNRVTMQVSFASDAQEYPVENGDVYVLVTMPKPFVGLIAYNVYFNLSGSSGLVMYAGDTRDAPVYDRDMPLPERLLLKFSGYGNQSKVIATIDGLSYAIEDVRVEDD